MTNLFSTYKIKNFNIKNRVVLPPVVNFGWANENGIVNDKHVKHYEERAKGGVGIIIVEATCVNRDGRITNYQPGIWNDEQIQEFRKITDACHKYESVVLLQIHHAGLTTRKAVSDKAVGPSLDPTNERSYALSIGEIKSLQNDFIKAAIRAKKAGFDGIELHGAHGYLLNQFASSTINKREDEYGVNVEGRLKFAKEIISGIKQNIGSEFIIGYRMGANSPTLQDGIEIANYLEKFGVDLLHVSHGGATGIAPEIPTNFPNNWIVYCGTEVKKHVNIPIVVVNEIQTPERANWLIANGLTDFVAIGRDLLTDANWVVKAQRNEPIDLCISCKPQCKRYGKPESCPVTKAKSERLND